MSESWAESIANYSASRKVIRAATLSKADLVLKNATYMSVFQVNYGMHDIAVTNGLIAGVGEYDGEKRKWM